MSAGGSGGGATADAAAGGTASSGSGGGGSQQQQGSLTAGAWDDNDNYSFFDTYRAKQAQLQGAPPFTQTEQDAAHSASAQRSAHGALDVAFVIDTTGSMGDEIQYLQAQFAAIASTISQQHPNLAQRWALIAYRDVGDAYVVQATDFTSSVQDLNAALGGLKAFGGGDFPEAPDQALSHTSQLSWSSDVNTARLVFWIADAPPHAENAGKFADAVRALRDEGVHVYPVASSGIDEVTEYTMRASAQLTLGRYLFLTDDSGIGDAHKDPSVPCYVVTPLDDLVLRSVSMELSGVHVEADASKIIRSVGSPANGVCALQDGEAHVF